MRIKQIIILVILITSNSISAQVFDWAKGFGGPENERGEAITMDDGGNVYSAGYYSGTADFDPNTGVENFSSNDGSTDVYVQKLDQNGNFLWVNAIGGPGFEFINEIALDSLDNVYAFGHYYETVDFNPDVAEDSILTSAGIQDCFIVKYDSEGNFVWVRTLEGIEANEALDIEISEGFIYTAGQFSGTADFDPNAGVFNLVSNGASDAYVQKLDLDGNLIWAKSYGSIEEDDARDLAIDKDENILITGKFQGTVDFDPNVGVAESTTPSADSYIYIQKWDEDGNFIWNRFYGNNNVEVAFAVAVDTNSNIYSTGSFVGTIDFDPNAGTNNLTGDGSSAMFIQKLNEDGDFEWAKLIGGAGNDQGFEIDLDDNGNVYTTGRYSETADFDPNLGTEERTAEGGNDLFLLKIDTDGEFDWVETFGGAGSDRGKALDVNNDGCIILMTGGFADTVDFDPEVAVENLFANDGSDAFVYRMVCESPDPPDPPGCLAVGLSINPPSCFGFSDGSFTINVTDGLSTEITFVITNADGEVINVSGSNTANTLEEGEYFYTVSDTTVCSDVVGSIFLNDPDQISVDITEFDVRCFGESSGSAVADTVRDWTGDYDEISYFWAPNPEGSAGNGIGKDTLLNLIAGEYVLTVNDENGCTVTESFIIDEPTELTTSEFGHRSAFCRVFDYQSGGGVVFAGGAGGTPDYSYLWRDLTTGDTETNSTWGGLNPGNYEITITDDNGCTFIDSVLVDSLNPIASFDILSDQLNEDCKGTAVVDITLVNTSLNFVDSLNPLSTPTFRIDLGLGDVILSEDFEQQYEASYTEDGIYNVCLETSNQNGCIDDTCKLITVFEVFYFNTINVFTPNNDGANDLFTFTEVSQAVETFTCEIFNRWGVKVAEINSINGSWNGELSNGSEASEGVYFYTYSGKSTNSTAFSGQGNIHLVRSNQ